MAVSHAKSDTIADFTGTITGFNSQGSTTTIVATDLVRPVDWNSAHNQFYTLSGNTNNASTASGTNVVFSATGNLTIAGSTGTIVFSAGGGGGGTVSYLPPQWGIGSTVTGTIGNATILVHPLFVPVEARIDRAIQFISGTVSTSTNSSHGGTLSFGVGIYTKNASTLSLSVSGIGTYAWTNTSNNSTSVLNGMRVVSAAIAATLTPGNYWLGIWSRTSTVNANWFTLAPMVLSVQNANFSGSFMSSVNATRQFMPGFGDYSATSSVLPASMAFSHITGTLNWRTHIPLVYFTSGTE